jgi:hypothetical protein
VKEETSKDDLWWGKYVLLNLEWHNYSRSIWCWECSLPGSLYVTEYSIYPPPFAETLLTLKWMRRHSWWIVREQWTTWILLRR